MISPVTYTDLMAAANYKSAKIHDSTEDLIPLFSIPTMFTMWAQKTTKTGLI